MLLTLSLQAEKNKKISLRSFLFFRWKEKALHHKGPTLGAYNWTEIERYDTTDLQLLLRDLEPHTKYEILLQAYNQFGRGPVAKIEAETGEQGEIMDYLHF